jgi:co-chaperonin GroES (HSP10)
MGPNADRDHPDGPKINGLEEGMTVLIGKYAGDWINEDGKMVTNEEDAEYYIVQDVDVLAICND